MKRNLTAGFYRAIAKALFVLLSAVAVNSAYADYTPAHPYIYLDTQQIQIMRENVLSNQYDWATNLCLGKIRKFFQKTLIHR